MTEFEDRLMDELVEMLTVCADELEGELDQRYPLRTQYQSEMRRWKRDMETIEQARNVLALYDGWLEEQTKAHKCVTG